MNSSICCLDDISVTHDPQFGLVWVETRVVQCKTWCICKRVLFVCGKDLKLNERASRKHLCHNRTALRFSWQMISFASSKELHKVPQQLPHRPKLISPLCYGNTGVFSSEGTAKNSLSRPLARLQTHSLKHTPSGILLPACTSVCKHIPLAADPRPSCCHSNQSPSPWRRLPPSHGSAQARISRWPVLFSSFSRFKFLCSSFVLLLFYFYS